jgi:pimeloyl-ACP methyl ester carboxylesterase/DNA-binding winged helix-turn-helix (wHTH) protein
MSVYIFEGCELDTATLELRRDGEVRPLEPQAFEVLVYLVAHRDRVVTRDELLEHVWHTTFISDAALATRIKEVRQAVGDDGQAQRVIRTVHRRGYRFVAPVQERLAAPVPAGGGPEISSAVAEPAALDTAVMQQEIRFCTTPDGVQIAYALCGNGPPFVKAANWLTNLEYDLHSPIWRHLLTDLVPDRQVIRYDERGSGLSESEIDDFGVEVWVRDLETVVDALGLDRFPLLGISQGGAVAIAYAVRHPERVSHLILNGAFVRGSSLASQEEARNLVVGLAEQGWGKSNSPFGQMFSNVMLPSGTTEQIRWLSDLQRASTSPENAVRFIRAFLELDVVDLLPQVRVPTLILHARDDRTVPFSEARRIAAGIADSRLVPLDSDNHLLLPDEPARLVFRDAIRSFVEE